MDTLKEAFAFPLHKDRWVPMLLIPNLWVIGITVIACIVVFGGVILLIASGLLPQSKEAFLNHPEWIGLAIGLYLLLIFGIMLSCAPQYGYMMRLTRYLVSGQDPAIAYTWKGHFWTYFILGLKTLVIMILNYLTLLPFVIFIVVLAALVAVAAGLGASHFVAANAANKELLGMMIMLPMMLLAYGLFSFLAPFYMTLWFKVSEKETIGTFFSEFTAAFNMAKQHYWPLFKRFWVVIGLWVVALIPIWLLSYTLVGGVALQIYLGIVSLYLMCDVVKPSNIVKNEV